MSLEEGFTITWRLKNFSMCAIESGQYIESPVIQIKQFGNSEWSLRFYPKGKHKEASFLSCFLSCANLGDFETVKLRYALACTYPVIGPTKLLVGENNFNARDVWGFGKWMSIEEILKQRDKYLPNDTFTIICVMKCKNICDLKNTEGEMTDTLLRTSPTGKKYLYINKFCCETKIPVQKKIFLRPIRKFLSLSENERITLPLFSVMKETPSFYVTIIKNSPIDIEIQRKDFINKKLFVKCIVSAVNPPKGVSYSSEDEFLFKSEDEVWNLSPFLELSQLQEDGYFDLNEGTLVLQFDLAFSIDGQLYHTEKQDWDPFVPPSKSPCPTEIFTSSNIDDDNPIVTLCSGDRTFTAHKALLKAKSEVFRAMFESDMKEKETGVVDIPDVDAQTLGRMLSFLYSGTVSDLSVSDMGDLYAAAHKYQILYLMDCCSSTLMRSLSVSTVCEILILANLYQNDRLLKCAEDFVVANTHPERLFMSQGWENLMKNHASVAANVMFKMLMK